MSDQDPDSKEQEEPKADRIGEKNSTETDPTPEEQMAAFEEALKEEDWGHQPC